MCVLWGRGARLGRQLGGQAAITVHCSIRTPLSVQNLIYHLPPLVASRASCLYHRASTTRIRLEQVLHMYSLVPTGSNCASSAYVHVSVAFHKGTVARPGVDVRAGERKAMLTMHGRRYTCTTKPFSLLVALLVAKRLDMPSLAHVGSAKRTDTHPRHHSTIPIHYWLPSTRAAKGGQALLLQKTLHYQRVGFFRPLTECVSHSLHEASGLLPLPPRAYSELSFLNAPCTPYAS
ncbi:uncharacterized protein B0T23DRAFT_137724 [Neurospora hispaniola]|uniref:Uncharacterized protein n=1 Tax=Neurospora hispaniola TaxID=588809 RepID=A0AAJ0I7F6_9PEZI|nr:hypothetical protein B0T23DRAFT_137724 [Neurospora hispaniola]